VRKSTLELLDSAEAQAAHMDQSTGRRQITRKPKPPTKRLFIYFRCFALRSSLGNEDASCH